MKPKVKGEVTRKKPMVPNKKDIKSNVLRVLILEDNPADAELMERQLRRDRFTYKALRTESRAGFIEALSEFTPDLILADYKLPKFNALQALALRNKNAPLTPFIIITGSISEEIAVECMKQGADDYLLKDRLARLGEAVRNALTNRCLQVEKMMTDKLIEQAARKWTITFDAIKDGIALLAVDQTIMQVNQAFANLVNKPFREIIGKKCYELVHADRRPDPQCPFARTLKSKKRESMELEINDRIFKIVTDPIKQDSGASSGAVHIMTDITERKRAEGALRESEEQYRDLVEKGNIAIVVDDIDGNLIYFNNQFLNLFGYSAGEIKGKTYKEFIHPDSFEIISKYHEKRMQSEKIPSRYEFKGIRKDGSIINVEIDVCEILKKAGKISGTRSYMWDITKRKKMENELKDSEIRYHDLFENSSEFIYTLDLKGNFTDVNKAALALSGYTKSELLKMNFKDYTPKRDHRKLFLTLANIYKTGKPLQIFLVEAVIKDKSKKYFETSISLMKKGEQIIGFQGSSKDITERKRAEEQICASLQEKEVLLKEIHHRVKNNLQVISGLLTLQAAQINDERLQGLLKESQSRIWTMALIHQTLYQSGNLSAIDMADYIRSLSGNLLSSQARVAMPPTVNFDLAPLLLVIDKAIPLALIINELLTNTLKHAFPDGRPGEIRISLQERRGVKFYAQSEESSTDPRRGTACRAPNEETNVQHEKGTARRAPTDQKHAPTYELIVADNGIGLPAGFDAKNKKSLGLQLVTMLTKQLGGSLTIESSGGTAVHLTFSNNEKNKK
ncbi:MAG: PAS domain S-box protein [Candidatus Aminicenantes bacterium]|nr:PAS domain S-box protein [Candidatus Aminicenantes bacterium]